MTKAELIEKVANDAGIPKSTAKIAFESSLEAIKSGLKKKLLGRFGYLVDMHFTHSNISPVHKYDFILFIISSLILSITYYLKSKYHGKYFSRSL